MGTTIIGIGKSGIGLLGKAKNEFGHKISYLGIDAKGDWNETGHHLIDLDYRRPYQYICAQTFCKIMNC